jgi:hypothetical protein
VRSSHSPLWSRFIGPSRRPHRDGQSSLARASTSSAPASRSAVDDPHARHEAAAQVERSASGRGVPTPGGARPRRHRSARVELRVVARAPTTGADRREAQQRRRHRRRVGGRGARRRRHGASAARGTPARSRAAPSPAGSRSSA